MGLRPGKQAADAAPPVTLKELDRIGDQWHTAADPKGEITFRGIPLLPLLNTEVALGLRERWYGRQQLTVRNRVVRAVRHGLARAAPQLLLRLNSVRGATAAPVRGATLFIVQAPTESDYGTLKPLLTGGAGAHIGTRAVAISAPALARLTREGIPHVNLWEPRGNWAEYVRVARAAHGRIRAEAAMSSDLSLIVHHGIDVVLVERLLTVMQAIEAAELHIQAASGLVVASDVHAVGKALVALARQAGVPSVLVQSGMYGEGTDAVTIGFLPVTADIVCVWGQAAKRILCDHGVPAARVRVTGQPRFDKIASITRHTHGAAARARVGVGDSRKLVTFASQNIFRRPESLRPLIAALTGIARGPAAPAVMVKLHPAEHATLWRKALDEGGGQDISLLKTEPIHHVLAASDVVITSFSTAGLEALMLGVPVVVVTDSERAGEMKYVERGAAIPASLATLPAAVGELLADSSLRGRVMSRAADFVSDYAGELDGGACDRVLDVVREVRVTPPSPTR